MNADSISRGIISVPTLRSIKVEWTIWRPTDNGDKDQLYIRRVCIFHLTQAIDDAIGHIGCASRSVVVSMEYPLLLQRGRVMWLLGLKHEGPAVKACKVRVTDGEIEMALQILFFEHGFDLAWKCSKEPDMEEVQKTITAGKPLSSLDWCEALLHKQQQ